MNAQPGWWGRNWKWAAPSGCLLVLLLAFGGCVGMVAGVFGMMKNTGAYEQAMTRLQHSPEAIAVLGEPIKAGWMISGNFNDSGASGEANYSVPVSGPRGKGTLYVEARKSVGRWSFQVLTFVPDNGGESIDLLTPAEAGQPADVEDCPQPCTHETGDASSA